MFLDRLPIKNVYEYFYQQEKASLQQSGANGRHTIYHHYLSRAYSNQLQKRIRTTLSIHQEMRAHYFNTNISVGENIIAMIGKNAAVNIERDALEGNVA